MKTIQDWWTERKDESRKAELENIQSSFTVAEKDGRIYLIHNGYAFAIMPQHATADEIAAKLNEARKASLEFEGL